MTKLSNYWLAIALVAAGYLGLSQTLTHSGAQSSEQSCQLDSDGCTDDECEGYDDCDDCEEHEHSES